MHRSHRFILEATRDTKKTLYVVAGFYVVVGFALALISAVNGDRLGTFLGFLIISGAISAAALIRAVLRIGLRISAMSETLDNIQTRLDALSTAAAGSNDQNSTRNASRAPEDDSPRTGVWRNDNIESQTPIGGGELSHSLGPPESSTIVDLMSAPPADADDLTAAHLDRCAFPRLVTLLEREPLIGPAAAVEAAGQGQPQDHGWPTALFRPIAHDHPTEDAPPAEAVAKKVSAVAEAVATDNLRREWTTVCQNGDVLRARRILLALADTLDEREVEQLQADLDELTDQTEASLRLEFADCARRRDFDGLSRTGERIRELLPDRPIADDFARIEPWLTQRIEPEDEGSVQEGESSPASAPRLIQSAS